MVNGGPGAGGGPTTAGCLVELDGGSGGVIIRGKYPFKKLINLACLLAKFDWWRRMVERNGTSPGAGTPGFTGVNYQLNKCMSLCFWFCYR